MATVSWSEVKLFRKCMKAHSYRYDERIKRKRKSLGLLRGSILHDMVNAFVQHRRIADFTGPDPWAVLAEYAKKHATLFKEEMEEYGDIIGDCTKIFEGYVKRWTKDGLTYEGSEEFVATDLADDIRLIGYIDRRVVDKEGRRWLMDSKFMKTIPTAEDRFVELQLLIYYWAWERWSSDKPIDGIIWDYARAKAPAVPELLKRGGLSKRQNIDSDWPTYRQAIKDNGLKEKDYLDMKEKLEGKERSFFERVKLPAPPKKMVEQIVEDFRVTAVMIQKMKGIAPRTGMSMFNCKTCEYKALCEAELRGHDADFIRKAHYEKREPHRETEVDYGEEETA